MQKTTKTVNGLSVTVDNSLADFEVLKKASTNVDYFAIRRETSQLFIQFSNDTCFLYHSVPPEVLEQAKEAESIGKFFHASVKCKYEYESVGSNLITVAPPEETDFVFGIQDDDFAGDPRDDFDDIGSNSHGLSIFDEIDDL